MLIIGLLWRLSQTTEPENKLKWFYPLAVLTGAGFYLEIYWPAVAATVVISVLIFAIIKKGIWLKYATLLILLVAIIALPMAEARLKPPGILPIANNFHLSSIPRSFVIYFSGIFWHGFNSVPYGPNWGGFLNPVAASLFFLGFISLFSKTSFHFLKYYILFSLILFLLPGALSSSIDLLRINALLPIIVLLEIMGMESLLSSRFRKILFPQIVIFMFLSLSVLLDTYHFLGPYSDINKIPLNRQWRNLSYENAYHILKNESNLMGSLYLFSEFNMDYDNKTLNVACYPFDALQNQKLDRSKTAFAALLVKMDYAPNLLSAFPGTQINVLPTGATNDDVLQMGLFLIPIQQISEKTIQDLAKADEICREINLQIKNKNPNKRWDIFVDKFKENKNIFKTDAFLRTIFWEKVAFFYYLSSDFRKASEAYEMSMRQGLEVGHLYQNYGLCLKLIGENQKAEKAFKKAREISSRLQ
jgi:tetratricopeptide (TPR) repeat protein